MASFRDIAHRWANKDFGKYGSLVGGRCCCDERNFYSYNTVIAQWLDKDKNVMAIIDRGLSVSSGNHMRAVVSAVRPDTIVFRFALKGHGLYKNVDLINYDKDFLLRHRLQMVDCWLDEFLSFYSQLKTSKSWDFRLKSSSLREQIERLSELYSDVSIKKLAKSYKGNSLSDSKDIIKQKRLILRGLSNKLTDGEILNMLYGDDCWNNFCDRTKHLRKKREQEAYARKVCRFVGVDERHYKDLIDVPPLKIMEYKHMLYWRKQGRFDSKTQHEKDLSILNYIGVSSRFMYAHDIPEKWVNRFTGEVFVRPFSPHCQFYSKFLGKRFGSILSEFRASPNKKEWVLEYYSNIKRDIQVLKGAVLAGKMSSGQTNMVNFSPEERECLAAYFDYDVCSRVSEDLFYREDNRKQWVLQRYKELLEEGIDGARKIFHELGLSIPYKWRDVSDTYYGGNCLIRYNAEQECAETSKGIKIEKDLCIKYFKIIQRWKNERETNPQLTIYTKSSGRYNVNSFDGECLRAGCHTIAYQEMERAYNEIISQ